VNFSLPLHLTDQRDRGFLVLPRGDLFSYLDLTHRVEELKEGFRGEQPDLILRPGFKFDGSDLVAAADGTGRPAYDVKVLWSCEKSPDALRRQSEERDRWVTDKETEYQRRESEQKALLEAVIRDIQDQMRRT
jgi:hypothetical protein